MKQTLLVLVTLIMSNLSFAMDSSYWDNGFLQDRGLFYNREAGVFKVYGKNLSDVKLSLGEGSSDKFIVHDFKILKDQILFLNEIQYQHYCQSYSLTTFKQNFSFTCSRGQLNVSRDEKYFAIDWYGQVASCYGPDPLTDLPIYSAKNGKTVNTIQQICGRIVFGANNKAYSFLKAKEWIDGFLKLSLIEIDLLTNHTETLYDKLNSKDVNVEDIHTMQTARDGNLLGFVAHFQTWSANQAPGGFTNFYVFDLKSRTFQSFGADANHIGFMTNSGFFKAAGGDFLYGHYETGEAGQVTRVDSNSTAYFTALNDEVLYSDIGYDNNRLVVVKYNSQILKMDKVILPTNSYGTSAFNASTLRGKNNIFYLSVGKLWLLDTNTMTSRLVLDKVPTSDMDTRVFASDDQSIVLVWTFMKGKPTFSFYDAKSGSLIAEKYTYDGQFDCEGLSWIYALSVKVSSESRQAVIKCGSQRSIALVTF